MKPYWRVGVGVGLLMVLSALLQLPAPLLTKYLIDKILPSHSFAMLNWLALTLVGILLINNFVSYLYKIMLIDYRVRIERDIRLSLFQKIVFGKIKMFEEMKIGYLQSRVDSDVDAVGHLFLETILDLSLNALTFAVGVGLLFYLNSHLAIVALLSLPAFIFSFHAFSRKMNELSQTRQETWAQFRGTLIEFISSIKTLKAFCVEKMALNRYSNRVGIALDSDKQLETYNIVASILIGLTSVLLPLFVLWYGVRQIMLEQFTLGGFIAFNSCIGYLYNPVRSVVTLNLDIHSALAAARRIFQILDAPSESHMFGSKCLEKIDSVEFKDICYYYTENKNRTGLSSVSFAVRRGEKIAIVGETGSGKTTISRLLMGFDLPSSGIIYINDTNHREFHLTHLRNRIALVPQEPPLMSGTILDNISFFDHKPDISLVNQIVDWCQLKTTLARFPNGLLTNVFESGSGISGGEKQRIAIARALYKRTDIIVFDESTSALDTKTEQNLFESLADLPWTPGIIWITHGKNFLNKMSQIIQLNNETPWNSLQDQSSTPVT